MIDGGDDYVGPVHAPAANSDGIVYADEIYVAIDILHPLCTWKNHLFAFAGTSTWQS